MPRVEHSHGGGYVIFGRGHGREGTLVQTDWEFPALAQDLGWSILRVQKRGKKIVAFKRMPKAGCHHRGTDGTSRCPDCGVPVGAFIGAAREFLDGIAD